MFRTFYCCRCSSNGFTRAAHSHGIHLILGVSNRRQLQHACTHTRSHTHVYTNTDTGTGAGNDTDTDTATHTDTHAHT